MELTSANVTKVFIDCLFKDKDEAIEIGHVEVHGIVMNVGFHPERLESHKADVIDMLECLPHNFRIEDGGGWSFLNACVDKDGKQWGEHKKMEQLFLLGIGLKLVEWQLPREVWGALPGGMPYVVIL